MSTESLASDWRAKARRHNYRPEAGPYEPAMTFEEIASALATDKQHVWHWYATAIKKLRRHPELLLRLREEASLLEAERARRCGEELL